jgi:hypothetical protein
MVLRWEISAGFGAGLSIAGNVVTDAARVKGGKETKMMKPLLRQRWKMKMGRKKEGGVE